MKESHFEQVAAILRIEALLAACRGKVVAVGVGKSGHIAQKVAATLTSTGTPAVFLHPSDALHGGMGIVNGDADVVVAFSNSGETPELIELLPYLQNRRAPVVAVVGNMGSTLARRADVALDASVEQEACPLNLAPTASTTAQLALGDALAVALLDARGFRTEDFARSLQAVVDAGVDHVSAYALIVEDGTRMAARMRRGDPPQGLGHDVGRIVDELLHSKPLVLDDARTLRP